MPLGVVCTEEGDPRSGNASTYYMDGDVISSALSNSVDSRPKLALRGSISTLKIF